MIAGGVLSGTWTIKADQLNIAWFGERGRPPLQALEEQATRLAGILDRPLTPRIDMA